MPRELIGWFALASLCVACGGEDFEAKEPVCEAGKVQVCACDNGTDGAQACAADGSKWDSCQCNAGGGGTECSSDRDCLVGFWCTDISACEEIEIVPGGGPCGRAGTECADGFVCDGLSCVEG